MVYVAIAIGSLGGIANPSVQSVMSRQAGPSAQGELQGAIASLNGIAAVISPLAMTQLFSYFSQSTAPVLFPARPTWCRRAGVLLRAHLRPGGADGHQPVVRLRLSLSAPPDRLRRPTPSAATAQMRSAVARGVYLHTGS
jgi:DHA1 family tetracycline resistance protein-like MFS transporter